MLFDDKFARTVSLPVKYASGQWLLGDGSALPEIREDAFADLVLDAYDIVDKGVREQLSEERQIPFLRKGSCLWARVDYRKTPAEYRKAVQEKTCWPPREGRFVQVVLENDLHLIIRANKHAKLDECKCKIPALDVEADSVNHAYTLISTGLEPSRRSHTGNVFLCVYFEDGNYVKPLEELRLRTLIKVEAADNARKMAAE